jgi:hypothetical protein
VNALRPALVLLLALSACGSPDLGSLRRSWSASDAHLVTLEQVSKGSLVVTTGG